ncbi:uncharacterized protein LOC118191329 [Stegodyphus dumicola]|uniref:uncharacterized protein LOC118191329 n=1 Tax=Stegodyphus dumicola TaxID=202533 RepID=UPI0015B1E17B|nr:uncharacterized protein LOC118191329 [Stegodyphus dumicola]
MGEDQLLNTPGKKRKSPANHKCEIDDFDKCVIRQTIQDFYIKEKKVPSVRKLLPVLRQKIDFPWQKDSLCKVLRSMNFRWKKCVNKRKILIERPHIVFWRNNYLREMRKLRASGRHIVYIDETWIDSNLTFKKCWQHDTVLGAQINVSSKNRLIVVHAGSSAGFIPGAQLIYKASAQSGDYHGQMNYGNFEKWVLEKLLPNLRPQSVVCMDNAPYHTKIEDPTPTKYATKQTMVNWLMKKTICCDPKMRKAELFSLIECNRPKKVIYKIDNIIKENGHHVVRLPPYHCDLNAIEYVWSSVKRLIRERNVTGDLSLENLKNLTQKALDEVTSQEWQAHCNHVEKLENYYWDKDELLEEIVDGLIIQTGSSDSDSDSEETESCDSDSDDFSDFIPL